MPKAKGSKRVSWHCERCGYVPSRLPGAHGRSVLLVYESDREEWHVHGCDFKDNEALTLSISTKLRAEAVEALAAAKRYILDGTIPKGDDNRG